MAVLMRPSRSLLRLAAGDAVAGLPDGAAARRRARHGGSHNTGHAPPPPVYRSLSPPPLAVAPSADRTGELERLTKLHDAGALTDAEFGAAKAQVLRV
jgi:putative oligomerization/nucleic acid binding protein